MTRSNPKGGDKEAFLLYMERFKAATRRYSKQQMQWWRGNDTTMSFVPVDVNRGKAGVLEAVEDVQRLASLDRREWEAELQREDGTNLRTRRENEAQGKGMKTFKSTNALTESEIDEAVRIADAFTTEGIT